MRQVILASHGKLAEGLLNSLRMIIGEELTQDVETYCLFPGENPNDFMNKLKERIATNPQMEFVILCDIKGGSVHTSLIAAVCASQCEGIQRNEYEFGHGYSVILSASD